MAPGANQAGGAAPNQAAKPEQTPKQLFVERVKSSSNILVTVGKNPSIDQLAGAIGLSLMLTKMDKHSTAVASGVIPSTIKFLEPEKVLRENVDNLRDFIISLDKEKADKLRYKVEDDVVKIYITPYRDALSQQDLVFTQGEINVELVIALGVSNKGGLDQAIAAHGKILHDATIVTINTGDRQGNLGSINWNEPTASSVSEMLVSVSEAFQGGLLDQQISNALLTGIVAATDKFSGDNTTPKVMTMSAQLMAAGADQHLIIDNIDKAAQDALRQQFAQEKTNQKPRNNNKPKNIEPMPDATVPPPQQPKNEQPAAQPVEQVAPVAAAPELPKQAPVNTKSKSKKNKKSSSNKPKSSLPDIGPPQAVPASVPKNTPSTPAAVGDFGIKVEETVKEVKKTEPAVVKKNKKPPTPAEIRPEAAPGLVKNDSNEVSLSDSIRPTPNVPNKKDDSLKIDSVTGKPAMPPVNVPPSSIDVAEISNEQKSSPVFSGTATAAAKKLADQPIHKNNIAPPIMPVSNNTKSPPIQAAPAPEPVQQPTVLTDGDGSHLNAARDSVEEALRAAEGSVPQSPPAPQI